MKSHNQLQKMFLPATLPFYLHILIETPALLNFLFRPSEQLSTPAPQAHAVIRQYAILLFSSNLIALIFALRPFDSTSRNVAGALSVYHLAPLVRAVARVVDGDVVCGKGLGGPIVHAVMHSVCFAALVGAFLA